MPITRTDEYEYVNDNSTIADSYARRLNAYHNGGKKMSVQEYVNTLINRAGMTDYIRMVNSELDQQNKKEAQSKPEPKSLLEYDDIKKAVDESISRREFTSPINLLIKLQNLVKDDGRITPGLKNVMGDKLLIQYIKKAMGFSDDKDIDYSSGMKFTTNIAPAVNEQDSGSYYSFDKKQ